MLVVICQDVGYIICVQLSIIVAVEGLCVLKLFSEINVCCVLKYDM